MIHEVLKLTRPLILFDTETTGTNTREDRILELGFQVWESTGMTKSWRSLINPRVPIPAVAAKVHGIDDGIFQQCRQCGGPRENHGDDHEFHEWPSFGQLARSIASGFSNCDFGGKNIRFDLRILAAEMDRESVTWSYLGANVIDIDRIEQLGEPRSLSHLYKKYTGKDHDGAHGAMADVEASAEVIVAQMTKFEQLPRDLDELHALLWPGWIDPEGKFKFVNGVPCFGQWGKYQNQPMKAADRGYWDFILRSDFSADIKQLAEAAKLGRFPAPRESRHPELERREEEAQ